MRLRRLVESAHFHTFIVAVIVLNAVLIGLGTYLADARILRGIAVIESICVGIFLVEIILRFMARESTAALFP